MPPWALGPVGVLFGVWAAAGIVDPTWAGGVGAFVVSLAGGAAKFSDTGVGVDFCEA